MKASRIQILLTKITDLNIEQEKWIEKLPMDISSAFYDNTMTSSKGMQIDALIEFIFNDWSEDVFLFLYESSPHKITTTKGYYEIHNVKEYVDYMVAEGFATEDRI